MNPNIRRAIEGRILSRIVDDLLALGHELSVNYGEAQDDVHRSRDRAAILGALQACDEERIYVHHAGQERAFGWVFLVYGNDGTDVVSDYTTNLEEALKGANTLALDIEAGDLFPAR